MTRRIRVGCAVAVALLAAATRGAGAEEALTRVLTVRGDRLLELEVRATRGDVQILHGRDGQVTITMRARSQAGEALDRDRLARALAIRQTDNGVRLDLQPQADAEHFGFSYRIDVPHWARVSSSVARGRLTVMGVMGPVDAATDDGPIHVSYVSREVSARTRVGDLNIEVVGARVSASAETGDVSSKRIAQGGSFETGDGNITLTAVGSSAATVHSGAGRIDIQGASGRLEAQTVSGELHVRASPRLDWKLVSDSGPIRTELPPAVAFNLIAQTDSGTIDIRREDLPGAGPDARRFQRKAGSGGHQVELRSRSGRILVQ